MAKNKLKTAFLNIVLLLIATVVAFIVGELVLGAFATKTFRIWPPNLKEEFIIKEGVLPGVTGRNRFYINSKGIRGDEFSSEQNYHILAVGGSTTECIFLDNEEAWPRLTQTLLNEGGKNTWIGNVGKSGARLKNHLPDLEKINRRFPKIDAFVLLLGINDLYDAYNFTLEGTRPPEPNQEGPFYTQTKIWESFRQIRENLNIKASEKVLVQDKAGAIYDVWREARRKAPKTDVMPEIGPWLKSYEKNLHQLLDFAKQKGKRMILMTQPTLWKNPMPPEEDQLLWAGWGHSHQQDSTRYYSIRVMKEGIDQFNGVLRKVCEDRNAECIDLALMLPKDTSVFYDDCHFNESGSQKVASILTDYLTKTASVKLP